MIAYLVVASREEPERLVAAGHAEAARLEAAEAFHRISGSHPVGLLLIGEIGGHERQPHRVVEVIVHRAGDSAVLLLRLVTAVCPARSRFGAVRIPSPRIVALRVVEIRPDSGSATGPAWRTVVARIRMEYFLDFVTRCDSWDPDTNENSPHCLRSHNRAA